MSAETCLPGLDGRTPLGFMGALGVQTALMTSESPTLRWDSTGSPIVGGRHTLEEIAERIVDSFKELVASPAVSGEHVADDLKFSTAADVRAYLEFAHVGGRLPAAFAAAQVSEGAVVRVGKSKPSTLHFTSGQMKFLSIARGIATGRNPAKKKTDHSSLSPQLVREALTEPGNGLSLLRWGDTDGRTHALSAVSPAEREERQRTKRLTNPAPTALALLGMSRYPTWTSDRNRCVTQGIFGRRPHLFFWPLWEHPAGWATVGSFLAQAQPASDELNSERLTGWGITEIWSSVVRDCGKDLFSFESAKATWRAP